MLLCPSHVIHMTVEEKMYCAGIIKVGRGFITHVRLEQCLLCNGVYSSPQEADLWKIRSVFIHFVYVLQLVRWPLLLKRAVDICSLWLWCYICWYRLITLLCLRFNNFVRHIALRSGIYFVHSEVFMVRLFIHILDSSSVVFYESL